MNGQTRASAIQTVVILGGVLIPIFIAFSVAYSDIKRDISEALKDNTRQDRELNEMRARSEKFDDEIRATWIRVEKSLSAVERDAAVAAERERGRRK